MNTIAIMLIFKCEDGCEEIHSIDNSISKVQCKCLKYMIRHGEYKKRIKKDNYRWTSGGSKHRQVWKESHGDIPKDMVIHHIDGNHLNNDINNLECLTHTQHAQRHMAMRLIQH